jgi:hypothetical protein
MRKGKKTKVKLWASSYVNVFSLHTPYSVRMALSIVLQKLKPVTFNMATRCNLLQSVVQYCNYPCGPVEPLDSAINILQTFFFGPIFQ